jgi:hypothetical protein
MLLKFQRHLLAPSSGLPTSTSCSNPRTEFITSFKHSESQILLKAGLFKKKYWKTHLVLGDMKWKRNGGNYVSWASWFEIFASYKKKLRGRSPQANYTDRATAACRRNYCQPLRVEGVEWSAQRIPTTVNLRFLDRSRYFFIQVAPQLSSRGWVDPVPDPLLLRKSDRAGNRTGTFGSVARNSDR